MRETLSISRKWLIGLLVTALLVFLDQITKIAAVRYLADGPFSVISGVFELRYLENHGAAFGILQNQQWFFYVITVVFLVVIGIVYAKIPMTAYYRTLRILCMVLAGGAVGNLIDRVMLHYVRDFLYFSLIDFPIFNVADIYVTCGAIALFLLILFVYKDEDFEFLKKMES